jgi:competence protein ComEC
MKSPLAALAASFALGIFLARPEHALGPDALGRGICIPFLLASAGLCLLAGLLLLRFGWRQVSFLFALAGFVAAGATASRLYEFRFPPNHVSRLEALGADLNDPVRLEGNVISTPLRNPYGLQFDADIWRVEIRGQDRSVTGKVRLRLQTTNDPEVYAAVDALHLQSGTAFSALARLRKPRSYQNPGSFDFRLRMESIEDLYWVGTIKDPSLMQKLPGSAPRRGIGVILERARRRLLESIDGLYPPWSAQERKGAVLKAVLLGDRSSLDSETIDSFRKTGLYHLLVIAGLHVGLLALVATFFLRFIPLSESLRSALVLIFLLIYASLVEQRAATLRATIMVSVYLLARLLYRDSSALNAIGLAALILLLHRPAWLFESGFQFSFSAALLIVGLAVPIIKRTTEPYLHALGNLGNIDLDDNLAPRQAQFRLDLRALITKLRSRVPLFERHPFWASALCTEPARVALWAANILVFSAVLQLGLLLPMAETFHRVTFVGIVLNALAIPVMTALLTLAVPTVVLSLVWRGVALYFGKVLALVMAGLFKLTELQGLPAWLSYRVPEPPLWVAWGFAVSAVLAGCALGRLRRTFWVGVAGAGLFMTLIAFHPFAPRLPERRLEVTALDCGQGDALFLVLPDRTTMLVDAGGSRLHSTREGAFQGRRWDPGEDIVSPYLWSRGLKKIDVVVLSHAHEDHLGGLSAVVRNFQIGEFWHGENAATREYLELLDLVGQRGIPMRKLAAGDLIARGGAAIRILWPALDHQASSVPSNDDSLVVRISYGAASVLLPGDISRHVEQELMDSGVPLESQVLKVAHHGSKASSSQEFLARVRPRVALVSAEYGGLGNLPNRETLENLRAAGAEVFRTDLDGAVTVEVTGRSPAPLRLLVSTYRGSAARAAAAGSANGWPP